MASFGDADVERLLADPGIVRNRAKIEATLANARATVGLRATDEPLDALVRAHAPVPRERPPATWDDVPAIVPETVALARELKRRGFRFVGPTTLYALMQACGLVDDHLAGCPSRQAVEAARAAGILAGIRPTTAIDLERKALACALLAEVRRHDRELAEHLTRVRQAVEASGTTLTKQHGVGPIVATYVLGYSGDVARFPTAGHFARYNATAPLKRPAAR